MHSQLPLSFKYSVGAIVLSWEQTNLQPQFMWLNLQEEAKNCYIEFSDEQEQYVC